MKWFGIKLKVSPKANFRPFADEFLFKHTAADFTPTFQMVTWAINQIDERSGQVLIRFFGLDGEKRRSVEEIALETGHGIDWVRYLRNRGLNKLKEEDKFRLVLERKMIIN